MKRLINITAKAATAILAVALTASCVFEKDDAVRGNDRGMNNVLVQIGVSADGMTQTKADVIPGTDQAGEGVETAISTLRLYAYIGNVLSGYAYVPEYSATDKIYMDLKNLPSSGNVDVRFMAVANEGSMKASTTSHLNIEVGTNPDGSIRLPSSFGLESFEGITYEIANQQFTTVEGEQEITVGMPMYADATVSINVDNVGNANTGDHEGHFILQQAVNLTLTRSLAKIEVYAAEAASETTGKDGTATTSVTITGVSLANVPQSGNLFTAPAANATLTYTDFNGTAEGTGSTSFLKAGTVSVSKKVKQDALDAIKDPANYTLVSNAYYLAENNKGDEKTYDYGATDYTTGDAATMATVLKIDYSLDGGTTSKSGYVKMPQIKRNTWYKVLARIKANGEIKLTLQVLPWTEGNGTTVNFTDQPSFDSSYGLQWNGVKLDGTNEYMLDTPAGSSVTCTFKITAPVGGKWYATLTDGDIQNYEIIGGTEGTDKASGNINGLATFTIKTKNSNFESPSLRDVKLVITAVDKNGRSMVLDFNEQGFFIVKQDNN